MLPLMERVFESRAETIRTAKVVGKESGAMMEAALSVAMIAVFLLASGGVWLIAKQRDRKRGLLMLVAAAVIAANVAIWSLPVSPPAGNTASPDR